MVSHLLEHDEHGLLPSNVQQCDSTALRLINAKRCIARALRHYPYLPRALWQNRGGHLVAGDHGILTLLYRAL